MSGHPACTMRVHLVFCLIILQLWILPCFSQTASTLKFVQIIFRHGDRNPYFSMPSSPYNEDTWLNGMAELTQLGMRQARELGEFIRQRYDGFLNSTYVAREVYVRSSDTDRTLMTASCALAGLYPPRPGQGLDGLGWQPLPVHAVPENEDKDLKADLLRCKKWEDIYRGVMRSTEVQQILNKNKALYSHLAEHGGWTDVPVLGPFEHVWVSFDEIDHMKRHGLPLPAWVNDTVFEFLRGQYINMYRYWTKEQAQLYLKGGPTVNLMVSNIEERLQNQLQQKMILYSSHDTQLVFLLAALGAWDGVHVPPYTAALMLELHASAEPGGGGHEMRVYYAADTASQPQLLTLPGCGAASCPLDRFLALLEARRYRGDMAAWRADCDAGGTVEGAALTEEGQEDARTSLPPAVLAGVTVAAAVAVLAAAGGCVAVRSRRHKYYRVTVEI